MAKVYTYRWTSVNKESFEDNDPSTQEDWLRETQFLTEEEWWRGFERCKKKVFDAAREGRDAFPPSAVEFVAYCQLDEQGSRDRDLAYTELQNYLRKPENKRKPKDLSPIVYHTYTQNLDAYSFKQMSVDESRRSFNTAFKATLAQIELGQTLCEPREQQALPKPVVTQKAKKIGEQTIGNLRAMF